MGQIQTVLAEYETLLTDCPSRWDMLQTLIEIGKELPEFADELKIAQNKAPNCVSDVYVAVSIQHSIVSVKIFADAHIVKGFAKILRDAFHNVPIDEILHTAQPLIESFIQNTGIDSSFLSSRANTFGNMFLFLRQQVNQTSENQ